jgi:transcriptional regulator with XRE-family HTH domain
MGDAKQRKGDRQPRPGTKAFELQPDKKIVGCKLLHYVKARGFSQAEFARRVGTDAGTAGKWLHGEALANVAWWNAIASVLETSIDELLAPPIPEAANGSDAETEWEREQLSDLPADHTPRERRMVLDALRRARAADAETSAPASTMPPPSPPKPGRRARTA